MRRAVPVILTMLCCLLLALTGGHMSASALSSDKTPNSVSALSTGDSAAAKGADDANEEPQVPALREDHICVMETADIRFFPDSTVTRGMAAEILCALLAEEAAAADAADFPDVTDTTPHCEAIRRMCGLGLMNGYPDGLFRPYARMTRAEFTAVLSRFSADTDTDPAQFSDVPENYWASAEIARAVRQGWAEGFADGSFCPEAKITRREAAVMVARLRGMLGQEQLDCACEGCLPFVDILPENWAYHAVVDAAYTNELLSCLRGISETEPGIVRLNGRLCCIDGDSGFPMWFEAGFVDADGGLYHVSEDSFFLDSFREGLVELEGNMYYVPEEEGPFLTDGDLGYLHFGPEGRYTSGSRVVDEYVYEALKEYIQDDSLTQEEKLYAAYLSLREGGFGYRNWGAAWQRGTDGWSLDCAEVMYERKGGTCFYWASAFLYYARRLGYQAYPVCGGVGTSDQLHAWVMIEWDDGEEYIFDIELEWAYRNNYYRGPQILESMFKQPVYATNVSYHFPNDGGWTTVGYVGDWNWSWDDDTRRGRYALNRIRRTKNTGRVCDVVGRRFSVAVEAEPSSAIDMLGGRILSHGRREHVVGSVVKDPHSIPH